MPSGGGTLYFEVSGPPYGGSFARGGWCVWWLSTKSGVGFTSLLVFLVVVVLVFFVLNRRLAVGVESSYQDDPLSPPEARWVALPRIIVALKWSLTRVNFPSEAEKAAHYYARYSRKRK
jgi:hypothetical protein